MEHSIRKLRHKALRGLVLLLGCFAALQGAAANLVQANYTLDDQLMYNLYDDYTAELVDVHSYKSKNLELVKGVYYGGQYYAITKIAEGAIGSSTDIVNIIIRGSVKEIASSAFKNCTKLETIYLPSALETIDASAFEGCSALVCIYCGSHAVPTLIGGETFSGIDISEVKVCVPTGCADKYSADNSPFSKAKQITEKIASGLEQDNPEFLLNEGELTFKSGTTQTLHLSLDNAIKLIGFQCDLYLPEGLSLSGSAENNYGAAINSKNASNQSTHTIKIEKIENGHYRFITYQTTAKGQFSQNDDLVTINIDVANDFEEGEIWFKNIVGSISRGLGDSTYEGIDGYDKCFFAKIPEVPVTSIALDKTEVTLRAAQTTSFTVTFNPVNATNKKVTWTSSDPDVATVSANGVVTAVKVGVATITATTANGMTATAKVTVEPTPASSITITKPGTTILNVGESVTLSTVILPELTTDKTVVWTSSNVAIATVDSNGKVTAKKAGSVEITATCGSVSDKESLVVTNLVKSLILNSEEFRIEKGRSATLVVSYVPSDATPVNLEWSSSDASVATVNTAGLVSCIKPGTVTVTVRDTESGCTTTCEIIVTDTLYGDADNDGNVAVNDVVMMVNYVLEKNPKGFVYDRADVNRDGKINIVDITMTVDLVLAQTPESVSYARALMNTRSPNDALVIDKVRLDESDGAVITVRLDTDMAYTAMQFDLNLPENLEIEDFILASAQRASHMIASLKLDETYYRVMIFSSALAMLSTDEVLMEIKVKTKDSDDYLGGGYAEILNGIASTANGNGEAIGNTGVTIEPFSKVEELMDEAVVEVISVVGGVRVNSIPGATVGVYTLDGGRIITQLSTGKDYYPLQKGMYIVVVNGRSYKVMVKS